MESESSRAEMIGDFMAMFHLLRITGILSAQVSQCHGRPKRPEGEATMRDRPPRREALPISCHELLRKAQEKINKLALSPGILLLKRSQQGHLTQATMQVRLTKMMKILGRLWALVKMRVPQLARQKRAMQHLRKLQLRSLLQRTQLHRRPPQLVRPLPENADDDMVYPTHTKGQVEKYRYHGRGHQREGSGARSG